MTSATIASLCGGSPSFSHKRSFVEEGVLRCSTPALWIAVLGALLCTHQATQAANLQASVTSLASHQPP